MPGAHVSEIMRNMAAIALCECINWTIEKMLAAELPEDGCLASKTLKAVGVSVSPRVCSGTYRGHY